MPLATVCPSCQTRYNLPDAMQGKQVRCKKCNNLFTAAPAAPPRPSQIPAQAKAPATPQPATTTSGPPARKRGGVGIALVLLVVVGLLGAGGWFFALGPGKDLFAKVEKSEEVARGDTASEMLNDLAKDLSKQMPADTPVPKVEDGKVVLPIPDKSQPPITLPDVSKIDPGKLPDPSKQPDVAKLVDPPKDKPNTPRPDAEKQPDGDKVVQGKDTVDPPRPAPADVPVKSIDLLKLVQVDRDTVKGKWSLQAGTLVSPPDPSARLHIPYTPPEEYDIKMVAERKQGNDSLCTGLIAGGRQCDTDLDGWPNLGFRSGLNQIDARRADNNETTYKGPVFTNGKPSEIVHSVRKTGITVTVDGKAIFSYKGDSARLSMRSDHAVPNTRVLFVGTFKSVYHISKMELTPVSGKGEKPQDPVVAMPSPMPDPKTKPFPPEFSNKIVTWANHRKILNTPDITQKDVYEMLGPPIMVERPPADDPGYHVDTWKENNKIIRFGFLGNGKILNNFTNAPMLPGDEKLLPPSKMTQENFDKIQLGWSASQVKDLFGQETEQKRLPRQQHMYWRDKAANKEWLIVFEGLKVVAKGQGAIGEATAVVDPKDAPTRARAETKADQDKAIALGKKLGANYTIEKNHVVEINLGVLLPKKVLEKDMPVLLQPFTKCRELVLFGAKITDATADMLKDFNDLEVLSLQGTPITDKGLENLKDKKKLRILNLYACNNVTDAGLEHLKDLKGLKILMVGKTEITAKGFEVIKGFKSLEELDVSDCKGITDKDLDDLKNALPKLKKLNSRVVN